VRSDLRAGRWAGAFARVESGGGSLRTIGDGGGGVHKEGITRKYDAEVPAPGPPKEDIMIKKIRASSSNDIRQLSN